MQFTEALKQLEKHTDSMCKHLIRKAWGEYFDYERGVRLDIDESPYDGDHVLLTGTSDLGFEDYTADDWKIEDLPYVLTFRQSVWRRELAIRAKRKPGTAFRIIKTASYKETREIHFSSDSAVHALVQIRVTQHLKDGDNVVLMSPTTADILCEEWLYEESKEK